MDILLAKLDVMFLIFIFLCLLGLTSPYCTPVGGGSPSKTNKGGDRDNGGGTGIERERGLRPLAGVQEGLVLKKVPAMVDRKLDSASKNSLRKMAEADTALCGSYCYDSGLSFYCEYGCCGDYGDEYCCGVSSWVVAVSVIGVLVVISIALVVFCYVKKKHMRRGRVMNTHTNVVHAPPPPAGFQPPPAYQQHPPGYAPQQQHPGYNPQQPGVYPPPPPTNYGADPAYPPAIH